MIRVGVGRLGLVAVLAGALAWPGLAGSSGASGQHRPHGDDHRRQAAEAEAKAVAEVETGGKAVSARRVEMNGTYSDDGRGGIEVLVRMPGKGPGWRCFIDSNTMRLRRKERMVDNP